MRCKDTINREIAKGRIDYEKGRYEIFDSVEKLLASLHEAAKQYKINKRKFHNGLR